MPNRFVEPFDGPLRYHVQSRTRPEIKHVVELDAYRDNGKCSCENFDMRLRKKLEEGAQEDESLRCQHIRDARDYFSSQMLERIRAANPSNDDHHDNPTPHAPAIIHPPNPDNERYEFNGECPF